MDLLGGEEGLPSALGHRDQQARVDLLVVEEDHLMEDVVVLLRYQKVVQRAAQKTAYMAVVQ